MEPKKPPTCFLFTTISQHINKQTQGISTLTRKTQKLRKPNSSDQAKKPCVQMGCQESDFGCEKHSGRSQQQQQGICPACLRERLLYVASIQSCTTSSSCSSSPRLPPCYSPASTSSSACASPPHRRRASDFSCSIGFIGEGTGGGNNGLSKSRSVAFAANAAGRKKKGGFWSKLLRLPGKRTKEAFGHSRNFKEGFECCNY